MTRIPSSSAMPYHDGAMNAHPVHCGHVLVQFNPTYPLPHILGRPVQQFLGALLLARTAVFQIIFIIPTHSEGGSNIVSYTVSTYLKDSPEGLQSSLHAGNMKGHGDIHKLQVL